MGAFAINNTSEIEIDDKHLTIRTSRRACAAWVWAQITRLVQIASKRADDDTAGDETPHVSLARPWRHRALDWLSQIVYLPMIPTNHFLARLDREIDFSFVDELCLPEYK